MVLIKKDSITASNGLCYDFGDSSDSLTNLHAADNAADSVIIRSTICSCRAKHTECNTAIAGQECYCINRRLITHVTHKEQIINRNSFKIKIIEKGLVEDSMKRIVDS